MDLVSKHYQILHSQALSPIESPPSSTFGAPFHSSNNSFPILAVAIIGILATAFLLVGYYIFVIKCCLNWHHIDLLSRFSFSRNQRHGNPVVLFSPEIQRRGLDESVIQSIPIFQFKREQGYIECAVCLNEFQEQEKLRAIPSCSHVFHIDCIDVWLQFNVNCPLCRTSISTIPKFPLPQSQNQNPNTDNFIGRDEDYVVIELGEECTTHQTLLGMQERLNPARKFEPKIARKKGKKFNHVSSMGDEWMDIREKEDQFAISTPIRRSFSMDSACDRQLYLSVQEIMQENRHVNEVSCINEGSSSGRARRSFFSFGSGRGSRSAVLPIDELDP